MGRRRDSPLRGGAPRWGFHRSSSALPRSRRHCVGWPSLSPDRHRPRRSSPWSPRKPSRLLGVGLIPRTVRFEADGSTTVLASLGKDKWIACRRARTSFGPDREPSPELVLRTGRPARLDDYAPLRGPIAATLYPDQGRALGAAGGPIIVDGRTWGAMVVASESAGELYPGGSDDRVARFTELVSMAISNLESRVEWSSRRRAGGARRVAELVAEQAPREQVFALVTEELNRSLDVATVGTGRFEPDGTVTIMAVRGTAQDASPGTSVALEGGSAIEQVFRTGRPAHVENYDSVRGRLGSVMRKLGAGWAAAGPIVVDGRLWAR